MNYNNLNKLESTLCECGHSKIQHALGETDNPSECMVRYEPDDQARLVEADQRGYCICTDFKARGNP